MQSNGAKSVFSKGREGLSITPFLLIRVKIHFNTMAAKKKATKKKAAPAKKKAAPKKKAAAKKPVKKAAKKKAAKKKASKKATLDMIISKSRTKNAVADCNVSGEFYSALNEFVYGVIAQAEARAQSNGRKTVRPQDL
jgi:membrane protein involved in colicin uptake